MTFSHDLFRFSMTQGKVVACEIFKTVPCFRVFFDQNSLTDTILMSTLSIVH